jgi:hypothetical protein
VIRAAARRLRKRLGRRGRILLAFGVMQILYGYGIAADPRYGVVRGVGVLTRLLPMWAWGGLWIACGAIAVVMAWEIRSSRDTWGYGALTLPMSLWSGANFVAWVSNSYPQAWTSVCTWGAFVYIAAVINRWPEYGQQGRTRGRD